MPADYRRFRQPAAFAAWRPLSFSAIPQAATLSPPHRISHRLAARLLRLPLQGGVIGAPWQGRTANLFVVQPRSWLQPSSAGPGRDLGPDSAVKTEDVREKPHGSDGVGAAKSLKGNSRAVCRGAVQSEERLPLAKSSLAWASRFSKPSSDPW